MSTFVLIPGAGGNASYWHLVESELQARGHHTIAVDLPAGDDNAGFDEYADSVVAAIDGAAADMSGRDAIGRDGIGRDEMGQDEIGRDGANQTDEGIIIVAQSMGGFTAPTVCERIPVSMLVLLNAMIPAAGETAGDWWVNTGSTTARREKDIQDGRSPDADFDLKTYFFHDVPQPVADEAMAVPTAQSDTPFLHVGLRGAWPSVPTRVLSGADDRFFPVEFQRRVAQERLGITPDVMPGGHLVALSQPAELATRLAAYTDGSG